MAGGYLYWDYARHFESTDDAFIAARQFAIAPKVSGYITAVPVTDNQHVAAGDVIARIDDRDYRIALEQAEAQVAAAEANIQNIDAQIDGPAGANQRQPGTGRRRRRRRWCSRSNRRRAIRTWRKPGSGTVQNAAAVHVATASTGQAALEERASGPQGGAAPDRFAEGATQQRRGEPRASKGPARPGAAEPLLHDCHGCPGRARRQPHGGSRPIRAAGHEPHHVRAGRDLGHGEFQRDAARRHAARPAGDARNRRLSRTHHPRPCRQHPARIGDGVLAAARPRTPPAITSRSCSACRSRSSSTIRRPTSRSAPACRWFPACGSMPTPSLYERLWGRFYERRWHGCNRRARSSPTSAGTNPWLIAVLVAVAAFMEVLDTTIANVALPYIAGGMGVSADEASWVVTTYLVSNAIILTASTFLARAARPQALLPDLPGAVHRELGALRLRLESPIAAAVPRHAGPRRRRHGAGLAVDPGGFLPAGEARPSLRAVRRRGRRGARSSGRRSAAGCPTITVLALVLSDQRPGRACVASRCRRDPAGIHGRGRSSASALQQEAGRLRSRRVHAGRDVPRRARGHARPRAGGRLVRRRTSSSRSRSFAAWPSCS